MPARRRGPAGGARSRARTLALCAAAAALLSAGCGAGMTEIPPPGVPLPLGYVVRERPAGPIVVIFPGRSSPTDDVTLGIRETALGIAERVDGSVALFSWKVYDLARDWTAREAALRWARGERVRLALVGHSWGGEAASRFATELLEGGLVDEVSVLVTIDAIDQGYVKNTFELLAGIFCLEWLFGHRPPFMAFRGTPEPDGERIVRHVNYYQLDSSMLHGQWIPSASENHEVWFSRGDEIGHGNIDNFIVDLVAEDVRRAFLREGRR